VPPPLRPEPPDWAAEEAERREREAKAERDRLQREIERLKLEEVPSHHPPARRGGP
jgi:hypothetical protein